MPTSLFRLLAALTILLIWLMLLTLTLSIIKEPSFLFGCVDVLAYSWASRQKPQRATQASSRAVCAAARLLNESRIIVIYFIAISPFLKTTGALHAFHCPVQCSGSAPPHPTKPGTYSRFPAPGSCGRP